MKFLNWSELINLFEVLSAVFIGIQVYLLKKQMKDQHEESRRIKTVELMMEWSKSLERETSFAETIVESLNHEQSKLLFEKKPFKVNMATKKMICEICKDLMECNGQCDACAKEGEYEVKDMLLAELRWYVVSYLNMLETILTGWSLKIVDEDTIVHQFSYLYDAEKGWNVLSDFRNAAGGRSNYPNIDDFIKKLQEREENPNPANKKGL